MTKFSFIAIGLMMVMTSCVPDKTEESVGYNYKNTFEDTPLQFTYVPRAQFAVDVAGFTALKLSPAEATSSFISSTVSNFDLTTLSRSKEPSFISLITVSAALSGRDFSYADKKLPSAISPAVSNRANTPITMKEIL